MPIIEITMQTSYVGKNIFNVFHYVKPSEAGFDTAYITDLLVSFATNVGSAVFGIQNVGVAGVSLKGVEVTNANQQASIPFTGTGADASPVDQRLPPRSTAPFRLSVGQSRLYVDGTLYTGNRRITNGYKRFTGLIDSYVEADGWTDAFEALPEVDVLIAALSLTLPMPGGKEPAAPVIYGRPIAAYVNEQGETVPSRPALVAPVIGAQLMPFSDTERRKLG